MFETEIDSSVFPYITCIIHVTSFFFQFLYIYNGNICPSLNPAKIFQFISRWIESTKSSAVGPNRRAVINTSNEVKSPLLWEFWIYNFSLRILERVLGWKHCKYKEWVSFFWVHGEWIVARHKQIGREPLRGSRDLFVLRNKSAENRFAVHAICLSRATIHSPWTQKKRHSFFK